ncbi:hypothetical protein JYU20_01330 [Bacteroidales bacterium AH-315-I05]|nr:hypothetical protein [Bacteroidales bacterium AH-315-I05]
MLFLFTLHAAAQVNLKDSTVTVPLLNVSYSYQWPGGDMAKRFLSNSNIGVSLLVKTKKNWIFGVEGNFLWRDTIRGNSILDSIKTQPGESGFVIDQNGEYGDIFLYERGFTVCLKAGKIIPFKKPNPNSGLLLLGGIGLLQHKIRIENKDKNVPQVQGDYAKGYDRLSNGILFTEFIGYQYLSNNRLLNFFFGVELMQAFTKNRRSYNFDTMQKDDTQRTDLLYGIRAGWTIPLYKKIPKEFYYY